MASRGKQKARKAQPARQARPGHQAQRQQGGSREADGEPTRADLKKQAREKAAQLRAQQERKDRLRRIMMRVGVIVVVVGLVGWGTFAIVNSQQSQEVPGLVTKDGLSRGHVQGAVNYPDNPPMGGDHAETWLTCGIYPQPVNTEQAVHSMEHGAVWITYQPDLPQEQVAQLERLVRDGGKRLLSPFEGLDTPIAISGWGKQLKVDGASDERLAQFIDAFEGDGPEAGASC